MTHSTAGKKLEDLRGELARRFQDADTLGLLVGTTCNFAFVGQVFFSPAMRHTSTLMLSYTDVAYAFGMLTAMLLLVSLRRDRIMKLNIKPLWIAALAVQATLILYCVFFELHLVAPPIMEWMCGAVFGVYIPLATLSWLRVHARRRVSVVVWNIMLSAVLGSLIMWVFTGLASIQLCACMALLLFGATAVLVKRLKEPVGDVTCLKGDVLSLEPPFQYPYFAVFLFSFAFVVAISFAELSGENAAFTTGAFFAPFLFVCVLVLSLKDFSAFALLNIAVPVIATATISASFLRVDPVISFDLAVVGLFLFLAYTVILLCAGMQGCDRRASYAFLRLMIAFSGGCIVGRLGTALGELLVEVVSLDMLVLLSILAAIGAMILCIRKGIIPKQLGELFHYDENGGASEGLSVAQRTGIDHMARDRNLGNREKEVLTLLLKKKSASEIAAELVIAHGTAKSHIRHLYKKLDVHSRGELFDLFGIEYT